MLTLVTYPSMKGQFSLSPFCVKAGFLLNAAKREWRREDTNDPRPMPHQKLPVLKTEHGLIPDSDNIRAHLEENGARFDDGLTDTQKAHSRSLIRMAEEHLYFHVVLDRWGNEAVWPIIRDTYFRDIPRILRIPITGSIRKRLLSGLRTQGIGRLTPAERLERVEPDLTAISALLWQSDYLFGSRPTAADFSVAAVLGAMRATPVETELVRRIKRDPVLSPYMDRMGQPEEPE